MRYLSYLLELIRIIPSALHAAIDCREKTLPLPFKMVMTSVSLEMSDMLLCTILRLPSIYKDVHLPSSSFFSLCGQSDDAGPRNSVRCSDERVGLSKAVNVTRYVLRLTVIISTAACYAI